jgi:hypothetical protein
VRRHLERIRDGEADLVPSHIRPNLFHYFTDDHTIVLAVSHDRLTAIASALLPREADDL